MLLGFEIGNFVVTELGGIGLKHEDVIFFVGGSADTGLEGLCCGNR